MIWSGIIRKWNRRASLILLSLSFLYCQGQGSQEIVLQHLGEPLTSNQLVLDLDVDRVLVQTTKLNGFVPVVSECLFVCSERFPLPHFYEHFGLRHQPNQDQNVYLTYGMPMNKSQSKAELSISISDFNALFLKYSVAFSSFKPK